MHYITYFMQMNKKEDLYENITKGKKRKCQEILQHVYEW